MKKLLAISLVSMVLCSNIVSAASYSLKTYLSSDRRLDEPVILVEGFDPNNTLSQDYYYNRLPSNLRSWLNANDKDLVIVNFNDAGRSITSNATSLVQAINEVNRIKVGNHPNAVIGFSMGGLVARWALKDMEDKGMNHQTSLYLSYDAPHRGANVPYSIKTNVDRLYSKIKKYTLGNVPGSLKNARNQLHATAARQMLTWGDLSASFYRSIEAKGYPSKLTRVAIANGSGSGTGHGRSNGQVLFDYKYEVGQIRSYTDRLTSSRFFPCSYPCNAVTERFHDNVPGSYQNFFSIYADQLNNADRQTSASFFDLDIYLNRTSNAKHAFVPTLSALDIRNFSLTESVDNEMKNQSPFDRVIVSSGNASHASLSNTSGVINALVDFHKFGASAPSRSGKVRPLGDISRGYSEWFQGGTNMLSWNSVPGASRYEVFLETSPGFYSSRPIKTLASHNRHTSITVDRNTKVAVRACRGRACSYPTFINVRYRSGEFQPY